MERNYEEERYIPNMPNSLSYEVLQKIGSLMKYNICKIKLNGEGGFFCEISLGFDKKLKVLIANNHVLNKNDLTSGNIIKLMMKIIFMIY